MVGLLAKSAKVGRTAAGDCCFGGVVDEYSFIASLVGTEYRSAALLRVSKT